MMTEEEDFAGCGDDIYEVFMNKFAAVAVNIVITVNIAVLTAIMLNL